MRCRPFLVLAVVLATLAAGSACGGGDADSPDGDATAPSGAASSPEATKSTTLSPAELGDAVFARYAEGIKEVTKLVEGHPPAAEVKPKVAEVKEAAIQDLVKLGHQYEALSTSDRAQVDAKVLSAVTQAGSSDWYTAYAKTTTLYMTEDRDLYEEIRSFNIITQYAFFDLLKKQEPEEAQRLGIK